MITKGLSKLIGFIILFLFPLFASAQQTIHDVSVCGIKMGTSRDMAESKLKERFGYARLRHEDGNLQVYGGSVGGIPFDVLSFFFFVV